MDPDDGLLRALVPGCRGYHYTKQPIEPTITTAVSSGTWYEQWPASFNLDTPRLANVQLQRVRLSPHNTLSNLRGCHQLGQLNQLSHCLQADVPKCQLFRRVCVCVCIVYSHIAGTGKT